MENNQKNTMLMWTEASKLRTLVADSKVGLWRYQLKKRCLARVEEAEWFHALSVAANSGPRSIWNQTCLPLTRCSVEQVLSAMFWMSHDWYLINLRPFTSIMALSVPYNTQNWTKKTLNHQNQRSSLRPKEGRISYNTLWPPKQSFPHRPPAAGSKISPPECC